MRTVVLSLIRFYQACLSPMLPATCRYYPSCSAYACEAVEKWGTLPGMVMALRRVLRCRPFAGYGYDPVPLQGTGNRLQSMDYRLFPVTCHL